MSGAAPTISGGPQATRRFGAAAEIKVDWQALLQAWLDAEGRGDADRAFDLLLDVVAALPAEWATRPRAGPSSDDFLLLNKLSTRLQFRGLHDQALTVCGVARHYAEVQHDRYGILHFELLGVHSCIALLDFRSAGGTLARTLGLDTEQLRNGASPALRAASALAVERVKEIDLRLLRIAALHALARYQAGCGWLAAADATLCRMCELLDSVESPLVSAPEVRVFLAEVRLDRGDFAGVERLLAGPAAADQTGSTGTRWRLIRAQCAHLQGRFSDADELLCALEREPEHRSQRGLARSVAWQRLQVRAVLNDLGKTDEILAGLAREPGGGDIDMMRALLIARRETASAAWHTPPPPRQVLVACASLDAEPEAQGGDPRATMATVRRTRERVRDDYGRLFNRVLIALHTSDLDSALLVCAHLAGWSAAIESDLIAARQQQLWALVYHYWGDWKVAEEYAIRAQAAYARLGMPGDQLAMCQVLRWLLVRRAAPQEVIDRNQAEAVRLREQVDGTLSATDRCTYALNKWSIVDDDVAGACRVLHDTIRATNQKRSLRGLRDWRLRRATTRALRRICLLRSLHADAAARPAAAAPRHTTAGHKDVYRLALESIQRRLSRGDEPLGAKRLTPSWLPADTAVLHYVVLPDRVELFLMTRAGCTLIPLRQATSRPDLWGRSSEALVSLTVATAWRGDNPRLIDLADRVGLPDVLERLRPEVKRLAIVPDDILVHIPFAALPIDGRPLVDTHTVSMLPAMRWVGRPGMPAPADASVLGVAVTRSPLYDTYPTLQGAIDELSAIRSEWVNGWRRLVDAEATRADVIAALSQVELVHFACHGEFLAEDPDHSGLLLSDGWLTVADVYNLCLDRLALAVVASCWGGDTTVLPGGDHIGLPFALLDQGAGAVIASLWRVPDLSNVQFTRDLYAAIRAQGPAAGLAATQREWARRAPPAQWAGYLAYAAGVVPRLPMRWLVGAQRRLWRWRRLRTHALDARPDQR